MDQKLTTKNPMPNFRALFPERSNPQGTKERDQGFTTAKEDSSDDKGHKAGR